MQEDFFNKEKTSDGKTFESGSSAYPKFAAAHEVAANEGQRPAHSLPHASQRSCEPVTPPSQVFNEDCMVVMKRYPDKFFDLAVVDPPYGIGAGRKGKYHAGAFTVYKPKEWDTNIPDKKYFLELKRVSKEQIIFGANYFVKYLPPKKNWIVWDKLQPEGISLSMHELAFYSGNGQAKIYRGYNGANRATTRKSAQKYLRIHQTQKPIKLYAWLFKNYASVGQNILDTHLGSGSSRIAAYKAGLSFIGCELDKEYFEAQEARFKKFVLHNIQSDLAV